MFFASLGFPFPLCLFTDPDWVKKILQGPCTFCDSPLLWHAQRSNAASCWYIPKTFETGWMNCVIFFSLFSEGLFCLELKIVFSLWCQGQLRVEIEMVGKPPPPKTPIPPFFFFFFINLLNTFCLRLMLLRFRFTTTLFQLFGVVSLLNWLSETSPSSAFSVFTWELYTGCERRD